MKEERIAAVIAGLLVAGFAIIAIVYFIPRSSWQIDFEDNKPVKIPDYNDYKPEFRIAADGNDYYVEYKSYEMENWDRVNTPLPSKEDAKAVIRDCEEECQRRYEKIIKDVEK